MLADHDIRVFVGVEGKWDIHFLQRVSRTLAGQDPSIPDLGKAEAEGRLVFVPLGGSSMDLWATRLAGLDKPEFYITDRDVAPPENPKYHRHIEAWNARPNCTAWCTSKRELENYLHPEVIQAVQPGFPTTFGDFDDVPLLMAKTAHEASESQKTWDEVTEEKRRNKIGNAKARLNQECAERMTPEHLAETDPKGDLTTWLREIGQTLEKR